MTVSINATPPDDLPEQVIVMDKELAQSHPERAFYLRIKTSEGANTVDLDGELTLPGAVQKADDLGHAPTHWISTPGGILSVLPDGLVRRSQGRPEARDRS